MARPTLPLPQLGPLFDSHCHLTWPVDGDSTAARIERAREAGVAAMVTVATDLATAKEARTLASKHGDIFPTIGLHPTDVPSGTALESALAELAEAASDEAWVAIGETGLDEFHHRSDLVDQIASLECHLALAAERKLPVILHCREAIHHLLPILRSFAPLCGIMHCYSEGPAAVPELLSMGLHLSFAGNLSYPKSTALREAAQVVPLDRLLIETDAPFLAPQPRRGRRNEPAYVAFTAATLAELKGIPGQALAKATWDNACRLFRVAPETVYSPTAAPN